MNFDLALFLPEQYEDGASRFNQVDAAVKPHAREKHLESWHPYEFSKPHLCLEHLPMALITANGVWHEREPKLELAATRQVEEEAEGRVPRSSKKSRHATLKLPLLEAWSAWRSGKMIAHFPHSPSESFGVRCSSTTLMRRSSMLPVKWRSNRGRITSALFFLKGDIRLSKHPNHSYEASPETLLMLAWCSTLDLRGLLEKDQRERSWHYPHLHDRYRDWLPVYPAELLLAPIKEALACFDDDFYGPALRSLVEYRLMRVDIEMVAHAVSLQGLAQAGHSLFSDDDPFEDSTVRKQREKGPANETDALWQAISHHAAIHERLHDQSLAWKSGVCRGARALQAFFLSYPRLARPCQNAPFFVRELLFMSLERVNWHAIAANVLLVEPPPCTCASSKQDDASVQIALFEELLKTVSHDLRQASGRLPDPQRDTALFLSDCCEKASNVPPASR